MPFAQVNAIFANFINIELKVMLFRKFQKFRKIFVGIVRLTSRNKVMKYKSVIALDN